MKDDSTFLAYIAVGILLLIAYCFVGMVMAL